MSRKILLCSGLIAFFALSLVCGPVTSGYAKTEFKDEQVPKSVKEDLKKSLAKVDRDQEHALIEQLKKAGASYFPELTAPAQKAPSLHDPEIQREMVGVYLADMCYAFVFDKNKDSLKYAEAIDSLLTRLGHNNPKVVAQYKKTLKDFEGPAAKRAFRELEKTVEQSLTEIINTRGGLDLAVDATYGWLIENLYLIGEIAAQKNYDPKFMAFLTQQKKPVLEFIGVLDTFKKVPEFAKIVERDERVAFLQGIAGKLKATGKIGKADVEAIRGSIVKARAAIVR